MTTLSAAEGGAQHLFNNTDADSFELSDDGARRASTDAAGNWMDAVRSVQLCAWNGDRARLLSYFRGRELGLLSLRTLEQNPEFCASLWLSLIAMPLAKACKRIQVREYDCKKLVRTLAVLQTLHCISLLRAPS